MKRRRNESKPKDLTQRLLSGELEHEQVDSQERFTSRSRQAREGKIRRTALLREAEEQTFADIEALPVGEVVQVHSVFIEVECEGTVRLCVVRKTLARLRDSGIVVGDRVRFRETGVKDETGRPQAVIEQVLPRRTILTRADSFKAMDQQPIVANADQMLIVVALAEPKPKWGLVDRMVVAALAGGLRPIICLNKTDLGDDQARVQALVILDHYRNLDYRTIATCAVSGEHVPALRGWLLGATTVLAGHSGVGKSTLIAAIQPGLDIRVGQISRYTGKGRHTTTSARRYNLDGGGRVIDTPGVKLFGLWGVSADNLEDYFPDVADDWAPPWRVESYERILASLVDD